MTPPPPTACPQSLGRVNTRDNGAARVVASEKVGNPGGGRNEVTRVVCQFGAVGARVESLVSVAPPAAPNGRACGDAYAAMRGPLHVVIQSGRNARYPAKLYATIFHVGGRSV